MVTLSWSLPKMPNVPNPDVTAYDVAGGYDANTAAEIARIRNAQAGVAGKGQALGMLDTMQQQMQSKDTAAQIAANLAMANASKQAAGAAAGGSPLGIRNALMGQAMLQGQAGGQAAQAVAQEQEKMKENYIAAAQQQRAIDIQKQIGLEQIAQAQASMGLKSKWNAADAAMEYQRLQLREAGIDIGLYPKASELAANRIAAETGAAGAGLGTLASWAAGYMKNQQDNSAVNAAKEFSPNFWG